MSKKPNIEEMKQIAKERGGECISNSYVNSHTKLKWKCGTCGNEWWMSPTKVIHRGQWCPICGKKKAADSRRKYDIDYMNKIAIERGGQCLSSIFLSVNDGFDPMTPF